MNKENNYKETPTKKGPKDIPIDGTTVLIMIILITTGIGIIIALMVSDTEDVCPLDETYLKLWECKKDFCESQGMDSHYSNKEACTRPPENYHETEIHCLAQLEGFSDGAYEEKIFYLKDIETFCGVDVYGI